MSSSEELESRLREEAQRTIKPVVHELEQELQALRDHISSSVGHLEQRLSAFETLDFAFAEPLVQAEADRVVRERLEEATGRAVQAEQEKFREATDRSAREQREQKSFLAHSSRRLRRAETQEEILSILVESAARFAPRAVLFIVRGDDFTAWSSAGYCEETAQKLAALSMPKSDSPILAQAVESGEPVSVADVSAEEALGSLLRDEAGGPWHAFPLHAIGRPVAALLAGEAEGRGCDVDALSLIMDLNGLCIENLALKILQEMKAAAPAPQAGPAPEPPEPPPQPEKDAAPSEPEVPAEAVQAEYLPPEPAAAASNFGVLQGDTAPQEDAGPAAEHASTIEFPVPLREETPAGSAYDSAAAEVQPVPAPPIPMVPREAPKPSEEEKLHSDAKRFARLLVSEIKLYNEHRVAEGRTRRDLYTRLKRDIDRSREMYEKRVSPAVTHKVDYFHDEVVRILGENDPGTLGHDYPGPRVAS